MTSQIRYNSHNGASGSEDALDLDDSDGDLIVNYKDMDSSESEIYPETIAQIANENTKDSGLQFPLRKKYNLVHKKTKKIKNKNGRKKFSASFSGDLFPFKRVINTILISYIFFY